MTGTMSDAQCVQVVGSSNESERAMLAKQLKEASAAKEEISRWDSALTLLLKLLFTLQSTLWRDKSEAVSKQPDCRAQAAVRNVAARADVRAVSTQRGTA